MQWMQDNLLVINLLVTAAEIALLIGLLVLLDGLLMAASGFINRSPVMVLSRQRRWHLQRRLRLLLFALVGLSAALTISLNSWLTYRQQNALTYLVTLIEAIPDNYWMLVLQGLIKSLLLGTAAAILLRPLRHQISRLCQRAQAFEQVTANDESIERFFSVLTHLVSSGVWGLVLILSAGFLGLPDPLTQNLSALLKTYLLIVAGLLTVKAVNVIVDSLDALSAKYSEANPDTNSDTTSDRDGDNRWRLYNSLRFLVPLFKRCAEYGIYIFTATLVLEQIEWVSGLAGFGIRVIQVISIFFISRVLVAVASLVIEEALVNAKNLSETQRQRRMTLAPLLRSTSKYIIYFAGVVASLYALDVNPAPILAGAGIIGLTLSLGAQNLVNDIVSGFFILFENYYLVGDYIATNDTEGIVEAIELRTTRIRHPDGQVQIIRNGNIDSLRNYSMEYVYAVVLVNLDYEENLDHVHAVIETVGQQLLRDHDEVLAPPDLEGVEKFEEETLAVRVRTKVKPGQHFYIERILRSRIKDAFDQAGIMITPREKFILEAGQLSAQINWEGSRLQAKQSKRLKDEE